MFSMNDLKVLRVSFLALSIVIVESPFLFDLLASAFSLFFFPEINYLEEGPSNLFCSKVDNVIFKDLTLRFCITCV